MVCTNTSWSTQSRQFDQVETTNMVEAKHCSLIRMYILRSLPSIYSLYVLFFYIWYSTCSHRRASGCPSTIPTQILCRAIIAKIPHVSTKDRSSYLRCHVMPGVIYSVQFCNRSPWVNRALRHVHKRQAVFYALRGSHAHTYGAVSPNIYFYTYCAESTNPLPFAALASNEVKR